MAVDLILLLVFVVAILSGYRKGIIMALCTLVILVISCFGASAVQRAFTPQAVEWMEPKVAEYIQAQISTEVAPVPEIPAPEAMAQFLCTASIKRSCPAEIRIRPITVWS